MIFITYIYSDNRSMRKTTKKPNKVANSSMKDIKRFETSFTDLYNINWIKRKKCSHTEFLAGSSPSATLL